MDSSIVDTSSSVSSPTVPYVLITGEVRRMEEPKDYQKSLHPMSLKNHMDVSDHHHKNVNSKTALMNLKCVIILTRDMTSDFIVTSSNMSCEKAISQVVEACDNHWTHYSALNFNHDMDAKQKASMIESVKIQMGNRVKKNSKLGNFQIAYNANNLILDISNGNGHLISYSTPMFAGKVSLHFHCFQATIISNIPTILLLEEAHGPSA